MNRCLKLILYFAVIFNLLGCSGSVRVPNLPADVKKISIPALSNKTLKAHIEADFTDFIIREFLRDGRLEVVAESEADIVLKGIITTYLNEPLQYDTNNVPIQYRLKIDIDIELFDNKTKKVLWTQEKVGSLTGGSTTYNVRSETGFDVQTEYEAQRTVYEKLAKDIVNRVIYGWEKPL